MRARTTSLPRSAGFQPATEDKLEFEFCSLVAHSVEINGAPQTQLRKE